MSRALRSHYQCARSLSARRLNSSFSANDRPSRSRRPLLRRGSGGCRFLSCSCTHFYSRASVEERALVALSSRSRFALVFSLPFVRRPSRLEQIITSITSVNNMNKSQSSCLWRSGNSEIPDCLGIFRYIWKPAIIGITDIITSYNRYSRGWGGGWGMPTVAWAYARQPSLNRLND